MLTTLTQQRENYFPAHTDFLIGLSGGVDSVVLLHLFSQQPDLNIRAIHIHHGLSPNANHWATFCQDYCQKLAIPLITRQIKVIGKQGLEANARQARYQAISELIRPNEIFVTAHHLDDQAETFFLALKRGSGVQGLSAMQAVGYWQKMTIFRPLLTISKNDLLDYATQHGLSWVNDESNNDDRFDRNFLRNRVLPELNQRFAQFNQMVARSAQHCADQQRLIEELLNDELNARLGAQQQLNIHGFVQFSSLKQQQLIRLWLAKNHLPMPSQAQLQALINELIFANADKQPQIKLGEKCIRRYRQEIFILPEAECLTETIVYPITLEQGQQITLPQHSLHRSATELLFCKKSGETQRLQLPLELQNEPLSIQFNVRGRVKEYGKDHREEMKKIWQKYAVPQWERAQTPLIFWQDQLLAVLV